jgi:hypothetical protein
VRLVQRCFRSTPAHTNGHIYAAYPKWVVV